MITLFMNGYDYCNSCGRLFDYLDLKPHKMRWYCKQCYKEILKSTDEPLELPSKLLRWYSYDYCSKCGKLYDYLELKPYQLRWYCKQCYDEIRLKIEA